jgi:hypothetical protein
VYFASLAELLFIIVFDFHPGSRFVISNVFFPYIHLIVFIVFLLLPFDLIIAIVQGVFFCTTFASLNVDF